jgi:hypothetical protein
MSWRSDAYFSLVFVWGARQWPLPNRVRVLMVPDADRAELERRMRDRGALAQATHHG